MPTVPAIAVLVGIVIILPHLVDIIFQPLVENAEKKEEERLSKMTPEERREYEVQKSLDLSSFAARNDAEAAGIAADHGDSLFGRN